MLSESGEAAVGVSYATVQRIALALPEVEEGTSYGTPSFKVRRKMMTRLWEDGETMVVRIDFATRKALMQAEPEVYYITDHYRDYSAVLVHLSRVTEGDLRELLTECWHFVAPPRLVAEYVRQPKP